MNMLKRKVTSYSLNTKLLPNPPKKLRLAMVNKRRKQLLPEIEKLPQNQAQLPGNPPQRLLPKRTIKKLLLTYLKMIAIKIFMLKLLSIVIQ